MQTCSAFFCVNFSVDRKIWGKSRSKLPTRTFLPQTFTPWTLYPLTFQPWPLGLKKSQLKNMGMKSLGLNLGVEKNWGWNVLQPSKITFSIFKASATKVVKNNTNHFILKWHLKEANRDMITEPQNRWHKPPSSLFR